MGGAIFNHLYPRREFELALIDPKIDKIWRSLRKSSKLEPPLLFRDLLQYTQNLKQQKTILAAPKVDTQNLQEPTDTETKLFKIM